MFAQIFRDSYWAKAAALAALPAAGFITARFIDEYQGWLRMGRGGLPYNLYGYCLNLYLTFRFGRRDTLSGDLYERPDRYSPAWKNASRDEQVNAQRSWLATELLCPTWSAFQSYPLLCSAEGEERQRISRPGPEAGNCQCPQAQIL